MSGLWILIAVAAVMFMFIGGVTMISSYSNETERKWRYAMDPFH